MRRAPLRFTLLLWLLMPWLACAATAIIYQPQLRDRAVPEMQWPQLFSQLRAQGFDTLVVQWTKYGDAFSNGDDHKWLLRRVREARAAGLRIVLGLSSDPAFFQRQETSNAALGDYLQELSRSNDAVAHQWANELGVDSIDGWYLPLEIDDKRWRDPAARKPLLAYLASEHRQLDRIARRPVYVTSFFAGNATPERYAELLDDVQRTGVRAWVQDGAGTGRLAEGERKLYLDAVGQCTATHAGGVVFEIFQQNGEDKAFSAKALPAPEASTALAQRAPCGGDSVFFDLRYLPEMTGVMQR
ncbi:DUF4434 domain-containing protein [Dyella mobilis]|uniref:DUF4434 domain-containing protein n=1 Tax=Dyella mobilis TaxID=1849582 RepID=A0ABS2KBN4_9GAMM|nr:DUF4434 domain-containing protein [Dyella mobilis]MBM7128435.1 DUF4434 domain-containing protein [Dyella mobilis]